MTTIGVDPGGRGTGIAVRRGDTLIEHALVQTAGPGLPARYLAEVVSTIDECWVRALTDREPVIALESVQAPNPHLGMTNVDAILWTAEVVGAIRLHANAFARNVEMVPPGGHGSAPLRAYPRDLVGEREKTGGGMLRHCRSAWDIAGAANMTRRLNLAVNGEPTDRDDFLASLGKFYAHTVATSTLHRSELRRRVRIGLSLECTPLDMANAMHNPATGKHVSRQRVYQLLEEKEEHARSA